MATVIRNTSPEIQSLVDCCNKIKKQIGATSKIHMDISEVVISVANASSLPTSVALANQIRSAFIFHMGDDLAHKAVDATGVTAPLASDLATAITLANEIKATYNTHCASTTYHYTADSTNTTSASDATDQGSLNTLLNELKSDMNAHWGSGSAPTNVAPSFRLVSA